MEQQRHAINLIGGFNIVEVALQPFKHNSLSGQQASPCILDSSQSRGVEHVHEKGADILGLINAARLVHRGLHQLLVSIPDCPKQFPPLHFEHETEVRFCDVLAWGWAWGGGWGWG